MLSGAPAMRAVRSVLTEPPAAEHIASAPRPTRTTQRMRVLDLDLDFFVNPLQQGGLGAARLYRGRRASSKCAPWSEDALVAYLEDVLGLSGDAPIPGVIVEHHNAAYAAWRAWIATGSLRAPFEVVHVDAHADLGLGGPDGKAFEVIERDLLTRPAAERAPEAPPGLTPGNYLLYAAAAGWLSHLTYVLHPDRRRLDLPFGGHFDPPQPEIVEHAPFDTALRFAPRPGPGAEAMSSGLWVPLRIEPFAHYRPTGGFDFLVVAQSPDFTPKEADGLVPIFRRYIRAV